MPQLRDLGPEARSLGYQSLWTNAGVDYDPIDMCVAWHERTGLPTGVSVVPIARNPASVLALAVRPSGARGYRAHFERMGYTPQVDHLEAKRAAGASEDDLARAVPDEMLSAFGYAGPAAGAAAALRTLSAGLDVAIVRVLVARPGDVEGVRATMRAALAGPG